MSDKDPKQPSRRDFIFLATGAFAAVGAASIAWPIVDQMNPDATALALSKIEVDISQLREVKQSRSSGEENLFLFEGELKKKSRWPHVWTLIAYLTITPEIII